MQHFLLTVRMWPAIFGPFGQHTTSTTKFHLYSKHIYTVLWQLGFLMQKLPCKPTCCCLYPTSSETYVIYWHTLRITHSSVFVGYILSSSSCSMDSAWVGELGYLQCRKCSFQGYRSSVYLSHWPVSDSLGKPAIFSELWNRRGMIHITWLCVWLPLYVFCMCV